MAVRLIQKMLAPVQRRVRLMVARAIVTLIDETKTRQALQVNVRADQLRDGVERFQDYGVSSFPPTDAEALMLLVGGSGDHPVIVAVEDRRYRPTTLESGEVCMYTLQDGIRVHCKADGTLHLGTTPTDFVALAPATKAEIEALQETVDALVSAFNAHTHVMSGTANPGGLTVAGSAEAPASPADAPAAVGEIAAVEVKAK